MKRWPAARATSRTSSPEPGAQAGLAQHELDHLLGRGPHGRELLLHGLLERHLAGSQARLDGVPEAARAELLDDQVEGVALGDRAVEIAGDEQGLHRFEATRDTRRDPPSTIGP